MYETIVVGADGSETAKRAVAEATRLAAATGGTLHLVYAYESARGARVVGAPEGAAKVWDVRPDTMAESILEQAAALVRMRDVGVETHALKGDPADALLTVAKREEAGLIVVGNRGMHGVSRVLGSVPNKVSHHARCNVLIVTTEE